MQHLESCLTNGKEKDEIGCWGQQLRLRMASASESVSADNIFISHFKKSLVFTLVSIPMMVCIQLLQ